MATKHWQSGLGQNSGDVLAVMGPLYASGTVYYVDSATGSDSNAGTREDAPFATLNAALTVALTQDIIVLLATHNETLTAAKGMAVAGLTIVGGGSSGGVPTATLRMNSGSNPVLLTLSAAGCNLFNIRFQANLQNNTSPTVAVTASNCYVRGCYFDLGDKDDGAGLSITAGVTGFRLESTKFVSVATSVATRPVTGFRIANASSYVVMEDVTVDAATYGFSAFGINFAAAVTGLRGQGTNLLRGADALIDPASTGYFGLGTVTGGSLVTW